MNVTSGDLNALKIAIFQNGPVSVAIDSSHRSFDFYSFGVYYEPKCGMCNLLLIANQIQTTHCPCINGSWK